METRWLIAALASLTVSAPVLAADPAQETPAPTSDTAISTPQATVETTATPATKESETRVAQAGQPNAPTNTPPPAEKKPEPPPPPRFTFGGSADFYYAWNTNDPFNNKNQLRAFDVFHDRGELGLVDLWAQYARNPVGGRIDIDFGPTAHFVNLFEPSKGDAWRNIEQLYLGFNLDGKKGRDYIEVGKWVTTAGAEVIEPKDNWLYSRGLLFTWAIPFYHFGGRYYHYFNDTDYIGGAVERGWNAVGDPGHDPGVALFGSKALGKKLVFTGNYYGGPEILPAGFGGTRWRNLFDLILAYNQNAKWSHSLNIDWGNQASANWYGASWMSKYALSKKSYVAGRAEWLRDDKGAIFGAATNAYSASIDYVRFINKYLQLRGEYRQDFNSGGPDFFLGDKPGKTHDSQGTFIISAIVSYN